MFDFNVLYFTNKKGIQVYILDLGDSCVLAFRGSDENCDWKQNFKIRFTSSEYGKIHKGFNQSWNLVKEEVKANLPNKPLYITGHSYGGALAFIASLELEHKQLITFGCPKVLRKGYDYKGNHLRVRNNNDIVTMIPFDLLDYRHYGELLYLDYEGNKQSSVSFFDRLKSHLKAWSKKQKFNPFYDHDINEYINKL